MERHLSEQAERTLVRLDVGGFSLEAGCAASLHVSRTDEGWRVVGDGPGAGWIITREASDKGGGLRLEAESGWVGRTLAFSGTDQFPGLRHLLLADGRLFRIVLCRPRSAYFELRGWETSGAYLTARPAPGGWTLTTTPAGESLRRIGGIEAIELLFAAEICQSDSGPEPTTRGDGPGVP